jgi:hypothetical protein
MVCGVHVKISVKMLSNLQDNHCVSGIHIPGLKVYNDIYSIFEQRIEASLVNIFTSVLIFLVIAVSTLEAAAQDLNVYISKKNLDCIAANSKKYISAKTHDYTIVNPAECPKVTRTSGNISNEYINIPDINSDEVVETKSIIVLVEDFECLKRLAVQVSSVDDEDLIHVNIGKCEIIE